MTSSACIHAIAFWIAGTIAESRAGGVSRPPIMVLAMSSVDGYTRPVRTLVVSHVILALCVTPALGLVRYVADIAHAPRRVAIRVPLAQSNADGAAVTDANLAVCHVRSHAISFLVIAAAKRSWNLVDTNVQGFVGSGVQTPNFAGSVVSRISFSKTSI